MAEVFSKRMPGEWELHKNVWLAWPYDRITFGSLNEMGEKLNEERLAKVENIFLEIMEALEGSEDIKLLVRPGFSDPRIHPSVELVEADYADVWTRDYLPAFIKQDGETVAVKWIYSGYGEKFEQLKKDDKVWGVAGKGTKTVDSGLALESGAIESNGMGVILTTEECLLSRNKDLSKALVEAKLVEVLGAKKVLWLSRGLINDHTDGHIDEIARFVTPSKIVCAWEEDPKDPNHEILKKNYEDLCSFTDQDGNKFEVIKMQVPHMLYNNGEKTPASYCNFFIGNTVVLTSVFGDENDANAIKIIEDCFPERKIIPINCRELIYGGGAIHCITNQEPK